MRKTDPYATHQEFLKLYVEKTQGDIIEFGIGHGSTGFILELIKNTGRKLTSVENNKGWFDEIRGQYPESEQHEYVFVQDDDWNATITSFDPSKYCLVFIYQSPWDARTLTMNHFKNDSDYIMIHDVDYFPVNNIFGKEIGFRQYDFSDCFIKSKVYYPEEPWPAPTGPPTLVGTNKAHIELLL